MRFWKYHGLGNDFILFDDPGAPYDPETVRRLCDRHFGIGADGILYIVETDEADAGMRIMNSDGTEAEMCGNGIRCVAKHLYDITGLKKERMKIKTLAGLMEVDCQVSEGEVREVSVNMGTPSTDCRKIPMNCEGEFIEKEIDVAGKKITGTAVSMGNPHFVIFEEIPDEEQHWLGPAIEAHPAFPERVNVEFALQTGDGIRVKVYERGAGWTLACGTGACATAVAAAVTGRIPYDKEIRISLPGGDLWITVHKDLSKVIMRGPAARVFEGFIEIGDTK